MVEFNLPKNSKVGEGKTWAPPKGALTTREYKIYRWNPDDGANPHIDTYQVDTLDCGPMGSTSAFSAPVALRHARAIGGIQTASSGPPCCCRPSAGYLIVAMRPPASASTISKIRSGSIAATPS